MENITTDFYSLIGNYNKEPLNMYGTIGEMFMLARGKPLIVTSGGKKLFEERPELFLEVLCDVPRDEKSLLSCGRNGDVYKVGLNGKVLAEKRYGKWRENGIDQIKEMAEASHLLKNCNGIRMAKTYCATPDKLLMEAVELPTVEKLVNNDKNMHAVLRKALVNKGWREISKHMSVSNDSTFVDEKNGEYEFILVDPEMIRQ